MERAEKVVNKIGPPVSLWPACFFFAQGIFSHIFTDSKLLAGNSPAGPPYREDGGCTLHLVYHRIDTTTTTNPCRLYNQRTTVEPFAATWAWLLLCFKPPHPREPLRKGLIEGGVAGFYMVL